jgi:hypothetical protein
MVFTGIREVTKDYDSVAAARPILKGLLGSVTASVESTFYVERAA